MTESPTVRLTFLRPMSPLSENKAKGAHWAQVRRDLQPWRDAAYYVAKGAMTRGQFKVLEGVVPITVQVDIPFTQARRRDPHNYVGTVVKAVVDGLVLAHVVPDDNPDWVTVVEPTLSIQAERPIVTITIQRREANPA